MPAELEVQSVKSGLSVRRLILELVDEGGNSTFVNKSGNNLEISASFKSVYGSLATAKISVVNLNPGIVQKFTTKNYFNRKLLVRLYGGYQNSDSDTQKMPLIYEGDILWARLARVRSDSVFEMDAMENFAQINESIKVSLGKSDDLDKLGVVRAIVTKAGLKSDFSAFYELPQADREKYEQKVGSYPFTGTLKYFLESKLSKNFNQMKFIQRGGVIYFYPNDDDQSKLLAKVNASDLESAGRVISSKPSDVKLAQMIGTPAPSFTGVSLRTLYSDKLKAGDYFLLKSYTEGFESYNGAYQILSVSYSLQLRGQNFYMDISAMRAGEWASPKNENAQNSIYSATKSPQSSVEDTSPQNIARRVSEGYNENLQVRLPAIVVSYDKEKNTVTLKAAVRRQSNLVKNGEREFVEYSNFRDIPVKLPFANNIGFVWNLKEGDTGWLVASDVDTSKYLESENLSEVADPVLTGFHSYNWGFFEPDLHTKRYTALQGAADGSLNLQLLDGSAGISLAPDGSVLIRAGNVKVETPLAEFSGDISVSGISFLSHVHGGVQGGNSTTGVAQ